MGAKWKRVIIFGGQNASKQTCQGFGGQFKRGQVAYLIK